MDRSTWRTFQQCGLRIRTELDLDLPTAPGDDYDVSVRWGEDLPSAAEPPPGEAIAAYGEGSAWWYRAVEDDDGYRFRFRDVGEFLIAADLRTIVMRREPSGRHELMPILLAGTVSAFVLALHGHVVLHASAVSLDDDVLAFVGQSGRGKSTLAALLCATGATLVTDDLLTVAGGPPVSCVGGANGLRLRPSAAVLADDLPDASSRSSADGRTVISPAHASIRPRPLAAIVIPRPSRDATTTQITKVEPIAAVTALLMFPRIHGWRIPDVLRRDLRVLGEVATTVPVYDVVIPWGPPFDPSVAEALRPLASPS